MSGNRISSKLDKRWIAVVFALAAGVAPFAPAWGQEFPSKNMRTHRQRGTRWRDRRTGAPSWTRLHRQVGQARRCREPCRRQLEHSSHGRCPCKRRWTYAFCDCGRPLHGDAISRQEFEFQPFRLHPYRSDLPVRSGVRRQSVAGRQDIAGIRCSGEVATRYLKFCISGRRHVRPSRYGGFQTAYRHRYGPRTVPRRPTGDRWARQG